MIADATGFMPDRSNSSRPTFFLERSSAPRWLHTAACRRGPARLAQSRRLILTRRVRDLAPDPDNPNTWLWNPAGATFEEACAAVGCGSGTIAIAGGTDVFSLFLTIGYDVFYLARAEEVRLPGGVPVFSQGRFGQSPEDVLRDAGLKPAESRWLDDELSLVKWIV
jgi:hypothetical protein